MVELTNSISETANTAVKSHESGYLNEYSNPCIVNPVDQKDCIHRFGEKKLTAQLGLGEIAIRLNPFINEIVFRDELERLRLIGNDFILEKYNCSYDQSADEIIDNNWSEQFTEKDRIKIREVVERMIENQTINGSLLEKIISCEWIVKPARKEWMNISAKVKEIIANGNPVDPVDSDSPINHSHVNNLYAIVNFPNGNISFVEKDGESFEYMLNYSYMVSCFGRAYKNDMMQLKNSFRKIRDSIVEYGRVLTVREQSEIIDPQEDYVPGEDSLIKIRIGG